MAERPRKHPDVFLRRHDAARRRWRTARLPRCRGLERRQLCRAELDRFRPAVAGGAPVTVGCTQEAPLFSEMAAKQKARGALTFVNIRETAGWSADAAKAGPKMAALLAAAAEPLPDVPFVSLSSEGVGADLRPRRQRHRGGGKLLADHLDRHRADHGRRRGAAAARHRIPADEGHDQNPPRAISAPSRSTIDGYAAPAPSSRGELQFGSGAQRRGHRAATSLIDLSGGAPLFTAADLRDGYLRADPGDPAAVLRAVLKARDLVGGFDKPRYITFTEDLCAHSRSGIVGCHRCLDLCPTGAIAPNGDHVRDRRQHLRRLRPMRRRLPDRRCGLRAAAGGRADAQAAGDAVDLS